MAGLEHVEIEERGIVDGMSGVEMAKAGGVDRDGTMEGVYGAQVGRDARPALYLQPVVEGEAGREIVRQISLAGHAPEDGIGSIAGDEVTPVLFQPFRAHPWQMISPGAYNTW